MQSSNPEDLDSTKGAAKSAANEEAPPARRLCQYCNYDLHGLTKENTCPECGKPFDPDAPWHDKQCRRTTICRVAITVFVGPALAYIVLILAGVTSSHFRLDYVRREYLVLLPAMAIITYIGLRMSIPAAIRTAQAVAHYEHLAGHEMRPGRALYFYVLYLFSILSLQIIVFLVLTMYHDPVF